MPRRRRTLAERVRKITRWESVPRFTRELIPEFARSRLRYHAIGTLAGDTGPSYVVFNTNSPYDPYNGLLSLFNSSAMLWAYWSQIYQKYFVYRSHISAKFFSMTNTTDIAAKRPLYVLYVQHMGETPAGFNRDEILNEDRVVTANGEPFATQRYTRLECGWNILGEDRFPDDNYMAAVETDWAAVPTASPVNLPHYWLGHTPYPGSGATTNTVLCDVTIWYDVVFYRTDVPVPPAP